MIFRLPGGSSSTGQTSYRANDLPDVDVVVGDVGSIAGRLGERDLQRVQPEDGALEPHRRQRDAHLAEQLLAVELEHLARLPALDQLGQHRRGRLRDRAAAAGEFHVLDRLAVAGEGDEDRDLVAAERVHSLGVGVGRRDLPVVPRVLVVVEDVLAVEVVEGAHRTSVATSTRRTRLVSRPGMNDPVFAALQERLRDVWRSIALRWIGDVERTVVVAQLARLRWHHAPQLRADVPRRWRLQRARRRVPDAQRRDQALRGHRPPRLARIDLVYAGRPARRRRRPWARLGRSLYYEVKAALDEAAAVASGVPA